MAHILDTIIYLDKRVLHAEPVQELQQLTGSGKRVAGQLTDRMFLPVLADNVKHIVGIIGLVNDNVRHVVHAGLRVIYDQLKLIHKGIQISRKVGIQRIDTIDYGREVNDHARYGNRIQAGQHSGGQSAEVSFFTLVRTPKVRGQRFNRRRHGIHMRKALRTSTATSVCLSS